ncbi:MAG TPA: ABC transporter permease [Tepidisphaeraceae bacterium]|jgi:NitT/TauT family transport system permease protein|nr:ABC transporter permease [Tepidisphaeraceae bacterium]
MSDGRRSFISRIGPPALMLVVAVAAWEGYLRLAHVPGYIMTPPSDIARTMFDADDRGELLSAFCWTALAASVGFAASTIIGILLAILLSSSSLIRRAIYPYTIFFQTVPIIAIAPMLVLFVGFGFWPVLVCAFIVSVFPVIVNTLVGLLSTEPALRDLFRLYGAGSFATLWKLRLPSALPNILAGLRVASGLAVIGTVVAEFMVGKMIGNGVGLGVIIVTGTAHRMDKASAAVLLASLLGLGMFAAVNVAGWLALRRWHASEK